MSDIIVLDPEPTITCSRCSIEGKKPYRGDGTICVECAKAENSRLSHLRQHNDDWMEIARQAELELWERQPGETDREYQVWLAYRDAYPSVRPTYRMVAEQLDTTINVVKKCGQRWDFPVRLEAWAKHCDELTLAKRQKEIVDMNERHVDMATKLQKKIDLAIGYLNPADMKPSEISSMLKLATEIEAKARLSGADLYKPVIMDDGNPELKQLPTDKGDIKQIVSILQAAGVIPKNATVGIETTQRIMVKGED